MNISSETSENSHLAHQTVLASETANEMAPQRWPLWEVQGGTGLFLFSQQEAGISGSNDGIRHAVQVVTFH